MSPVNLISSVHNSTIDLGKQKVIQNKNLVQVDPELFQKQQYFRNNIHEEQHQMFGQFCLQKKGNLQIKDWTIHQVKQLVDLFNIWKQYFTINKSVKNVQNKNSQIQVQLHKNDSPSSKSIKSESGNYQLSPNHKKNVALKGSSGESVSALDLIDLLNFSPSPVNHNKQQSRFNQKLNSQSKYSQRQGQYIKPNQKQQQQVRLNQKQQKDKFNQNHQQILQSVSQTRIIKISPISDSTICSKNDKKQTIQKILLTQKNQQKRNTILQKRPIKQKPEIRDSTLSLSQSQNFPKNPTSVSLPKIYKQQFKEQIVCKISQKHDFSKIQNICIKKHQIIHRAFFLPDYVMYHIQLQPINLCCKRNYEDFIKLRDTLIKFNPAVRLPFLQNNSWLSQTNIQFIKKQKVSLQYFLNELITHASLRSSTVLHEFLTFTDHKSIKRKFQQYDNMPFPQSIEDLLHSQGKIHIQLSNEDHHFIQKSSQFSKQIQMFLIQYNQVTLNAISNYDALISNFRNMSILLQEIKQKTKHFEDMSKKLNNKKQLEINNLSKTLKIWSKICQTQQINLNTKKQVLLQQIYPFMKYQQANLSTIQSIISQRSLLQSKYLSQVEIQSISPSTQIKKKSHLHYTSPELKLYKVGIVGISQSSLVMKYHLAFFNTILKHQFFQMIQNFAKGIQRNYNQRIYKYIQRQKQFTIQTYEQMLNSINYIKSD